MHSRRLVRVLTAEQARKADEAAISDGVPSRTLMQRAGAAAATEIVRRYGDRLKRGATVYTGSGKNGGDGWVVAGALASAGYPVRVEEIAQAKAADTIAERAQTLEVLSASERAEHAQAMGVLSGSSKAEPPGIGTEVIIDALLGTGAQGEPRGEIANAISRINSFHESGSAVAALDLPSGLNADTGDTYNNSCVNADITLTFGSLKRGHLLARHVCGEVAVLDSGMRKHAWSQDPTPLLVDGWWVREKLPAIPVDAHKGTRKTLAIVGGGAGMPGAVILAAQAALRSGIGLVKLYVHKDNLDTVRRAVPAAITTEWNEQVDGVAGDALLIGPGLGQSDEAHALLQSCLSAWSGPVVIDADALNLIKDVGYIRGRNAVITPHPLELARLINSTAAEINYRRFDIATQAASKSGAVVLLKGVPTVVANPEGDCLVSATGTPALATGGSGDVLGGILGTILAQNNDPFMSAACAAWIHGRAAELCGGVRGTILEEIIDALPSAWEMTPRPIVYPVLCELPALGGLHA